MNDSRDQSPDYKRIATFFGGYWPRILLILLLALAGSLLTALSPWPVKLLLDDVLRQAPVHVALIGWTLETGDSSRQLSAILILGAAFFVINAGSTIFAALSYYAGMRLALIMVHNLRVRLAGHMRSLSLRWHQSQSLGDMIWRAMNDVRSVQEVMIYVVRDWGGLGFRIAVMFVLMVLIDPLLTLAVVAAIPPLVFTIRYFTPRTQKRAARMRRQLSLLTALIEESMGRIRAVKVFGRESAEQERFVAASEATVKSAVDFRVVEQLLLRSTAVVSTTGMSLVLVFGILRARAGDLSIGELWIFFTYTQGLYYMLNDVIASYAPFQDAVVGMDRVFQVLDQVGDIKDADDAVAVSQVRTGYRLSDVGFEYEQGAPVLKHVDMSIKTGQKVAIVGESGSGKTTLISLLARLHDVNEGSITLDDVDLRKIKIASLRDMVAVVPQEVELFTTTVGQNIKYGRLNATDEEVVEAAKAARAHGFITALPDGYDTHIGEKGVKLSVGQQQRISLARAFLKDSPILLLDEPTSALDLKTEGEFLDSLADLMHGRTVVIVTHRLSAAREADAIYLLEDGVVLEHGSHADLLARHGRYYDLYQRQATPAGAPV